LAGVHGAGGPLPRRVEHEAHYREVHYRAWLAASLISTFALTLTKQLSLTIKHTFNGGKAAIPPVR